MHPSPKRPDRFRPWASVVHRGPLLASLVLHALAAGVLLVLWRGPAPGQDGQGEPWMLVTVTPWVESFAESPPPEPRADPEPPPAEDPPPAPRPDAPEERPDAVDLLPELPADERTPAPRIEVPASVARTRVADRREKAPAPAAPPFPPLPPAAAAAPARPPRPPGRAIPLEIVQQPQYYPAEARRRGLEGSVVVLMTIDPRGRVADARLVTSSGHDLLDDAALAAARDHRFRPPGTWRRARRTFTYRLD